MTISFSIVALNEKKLLLSEGVNIRFGRIKIQSVS